jgi:hypothetical protein
MKTNEDIKVKLDMLRKVTICPQCASECALCFYKSVHMRWCIKCNVSFTVVYNKATHKYQRTPLQKGLVFNGD